jgi:hypothetical protein
MTTILTICSANYLANAKTLGQSLARHNPDAHFVIGLVDRLPKEINNDYWAPFELIPVDDLAIPEFGGMVERYDIVELNTAVKPFYMAHLYERDDGVQKVMYLDPDMYVLGSLKALEAKLERYSIVLTPHSCTYDDSEANLKTELAMLGTGVFNMGFIATSRSPETVAFLNWWKKRMFHYAYARWGQGLFYDQYWVNLVPLYFRNVHVEKNPGFNMCYWNLFERFLETRDRRYVVNGQHDLVLYHFSSYTPKRPDLLETRNPGSFLSKHPNLKPLFEEYRTRLLRNHFDTVASLKCSFALRSRPGSDIRDTNGILEKSLKGLFRKSLLALPTRLQRFLNRSGGFIARNTVRDKLEER